MFYIVTINSLTGTIDKYNDYWERLNGGFLTVLLYSNGAQTGTRKLLALNN